MRCLRRDHHPGAIGQRGQQRRERRRQIQPHGGGVDDIDARHRLQFAAAVRTSHRLVALDVELDRRGIELLAVVEGHAASQLDRQRLVVGRPFVAGRELRNDVELLVDIEQLVAQGGEDDAPDEGSRQRRVEHVGVFGQSHAQCLRRHDSRNSNQQTGQYGADCRLHTSTSWIGVERISESSGVQSGAATGFAKADCNRLRRASPGVVAMSVSGTMIGLISRQK